MNIGIVIGSQQKGFLVSIGKIFQELGNEVFFIARDKDVANIIYRLLPSIDKNMIDVKASFKSDSNDTIAECIEREKKYGETFSMLTSYDRALGKGYLYNADKHPDIIKSWWGKELKYKEILNNFEYFEYINEKYRPDVIVGINCDKILSIIARHNGIKYFGLAGPRYGSNYYWAENEYEQNLKLNDLIKYYLASDQTGKKGSYIDLIQSRESQYNQSLYKYTYKNAILDIGKRIVIETYQMIKGTHKSKKGGYHYLGWTGSTLREPYMYKYFKRHGKNLDEIIDSKIVLFPLHVEPESSLMCLSPEFNNSMEIIAWVSKSIHADFVLLIKEHPSCFGIRSKSYFDNLRRIPNVILADPTIPSLEWIKASDIIITITGTVGYEAVYLEKPVLSYGKNQLINALPTVKYAKSFEDTKSAFRELSQLKPKDSIFEMSKEALHRSLMQICFDLSGFEYNYGSSSLHMNLAKKAIYNLYKIYPEIFG